MTTMSPRDTGQCLETFFGVRALGRSDAGIQWVEARVVSEHPAVHSAGPCPPAARNDGPKRP